MNVSRQSLQATEERIVCQRTMTISVIVNRLVSESKTQNKHKLGISLLKQRHCSKSTRSICLQLLNLE